jgi:uncharacterized protein DUF4386
MNSPKKTARLAGSLYLLLGIFGVFGLLYIPTLIVAGDAAATANNIMANESLYRLSFVSGLISQIFFIPLVLVLYKLLKPVNKSHAVFMVAFALVSIPITMLNQLNQAAVLLLLSGTDYLTVFSTEQLQAQVMFFLELSDNGIFLVQIFWGLWLFPFGYLVFKSGFLPRILGVLLIINCFGYLIDFFTYFVFPDFSIRVIDYAGYGEVFIILWLLIKGVNVEQWEKRAAVAA